jgi:hypothetical protein
MSPRALAGRILTGKHQFDALDSCGASVRRGKVNILIAAVFKTDGARMFQMPPDVETNLDVLALCETPGRRVKLPRTISRI